MDGSPIRQKTYAVNEESQSIEAEGVEITVYGAITAFTCNDSQLTTLDVSKNTALMMLSCYTNQLTTLDVSKNTALTNLNCSNNQLAALDVSKNVELTTFDCSENPTITTLSIASVYGDESISDILVALIESAPSTTGTLNIYGGDNATVHTAATTKGWTVNTNL